MLILFLKTLLFENDFLVICYPSPRTFCQALDATVSSVLNVVALSCRTQINLAWQWHGDRTAAVNQTWNRAKLKRQTQTIHPA